MDPQRTAKLVVIVVGAALGLAVSARLAIALARGGRARRAPLLVALIAALVVTVAGGAGGVAWALASGARPAPVSANLTLFTQGTDCSPVGGDCGLPNALFAVRADTGQARWEVTETSPAYIVGSTPVLDGGTVFAFIYPGPSATIGTLDSYALGAWRARDGMALWRRSVLAPCCEAPPVYAAGANLAVLDTSGPGSDGHPVWRLDVLRVSDGARVGETQLPGISVPLVVDDTLYQCQDDSSVVAMRVSDGALVWRSAPITGIALRPVPFCGVMEDSGALFVSMNVAGTSDMATRPSVLLALNATTGQALWLHAPQPSQPSDLLAVGDGLVVLGEVQPYLPTSIVALRASDGEFLWSHPGLPAAPGTRATIVQRSAAVGGGLVLVGGAGNTLWALHADTGRAAWQTTTAYHSYQTIGIVGSVVVVSSLFTGFGALIPPDGDENSYFSALRASDGAPYWKTAIDAGGGQVMGEV